MNKELLQAIDAVINDLDELSHAELQAKIAACKNGLISTAFSDAEDFLLYRIESFIADYTSSQKNIENYLQLNIELEYNPIGLDDLQQNSANDDEFQMAV